MKSQIYKIVILCFSLLMIMSMSAACSKKIDQATADTDITQDNTLIPGGTEAPSSDIPVTPTSSAAPTDETATPSAAVPTPAESTVTPTAAILAPTAEPTKAVVTPKAAPTKAVATPTAKPTAAVAAPTSVPVPTITIPTPLPSDDVSTDPSEVKIIAIDAGHQSKGNYDEEPIGPGSDTTKPKVSSGTQGAYTGVAEYELNLAVAKKVKEELLDRGYKVVMIRETNNVNLSNKERAEIANESGADLFIRIHADGSDNHEVNGVSTLYPSKKNPYVPQLSEDSYSLAKAIVDAICDSTGAKNRGAIARDDMSGINWCTIPVTIIEMGYMTNKTEDKLMQTEEYQDKIVQGICDGIDQYFE